MPQRPPIIAICGTSTSSPAEDELGREVGRLVAAQGATAVCGGLGGIMTSAAQGVREIDGTIIGFLPGENERDGNAHLSFAIPTGMGEMRNGLLARMSVGMIAIGGGWGTLSEIAFMRRLGKPVACLQSWHIAKPGETSADEEIYWASSPTDAVDWLFREIRSYTE